MTALAYRRYLATCHYSQWRLTIIPHLVFSWAVPKQGSSPVAFITHGLVTHGTVVIQDQNKDAKCAPLYLPICAPLLFPFATLITIPLRSKETATTITITTTQVGSFYW